MFSLSGVKERYMSPGGLGEFLKIAVPIVISSSVMAVQVFTDRIFLSMYSQVSYAASIPAGISSSTLTYLFLFTVAYVDVFVAQYYGKKEYRSIGPAIWQSVYLAIVAGIIILSVAPLADKIFMGVGHDIDIATEEIKYFKTLCYGSLFPLLSMAFSGFYSGRGKTYITLFINIIGVIANIVLDYCLIFGKSFFPELGITGAAMATNISYVLMSLIYLFFVISKKNASVYNTRHIKPDLTFLKRLLKFGFPYGITVFFDMAEFAIFMLIVATLGTLELTASNIAVSLYHTFIMPVVGIGVATSIMVGNYLGQNKASIAKKSVSTSLKSAYTYGVVVAAGMFIFSKQLVGQFLSNTQTSLDQLVPMSISILRFLSILVFFDVGGCVFRSAIEGAGDTAFVMKIFTALSIFLVILPTYLIVYVFKLGVYAAWTILLFYGLVLSTIFYFRYRNGKWKKMRVIEMNVIDG